MTSPESLTTRVTELEVLVLHLQRDIQDLNEALLFQQKQFDVLNNSLKRVDHRLESLEETDTTRDPADERPPHY